MQSWQRREGPPFCCHFSALFSTACWREGHRAEGQLPLHPTLPSCPNFCHPSLWNLALTWERRMVSDVQQVPAPWKPIFSSQNIPFWLFWGAVTVQSEHHTTPRLAVTKPIFCLELDWLKNFLAKPCNETKKWHMEERAGGELLSHCFPGNMTKKRRGSGGGAEVSESMKTDHNCD